MLFFGNRMFRSHEIILGQFLGIGALVLASLLLSLIGLIVGKAYIGFLGLIPIYLGLRGVIDLFKGRETDDDPRIDRGSNAGNIFTVAGITMANGGDNIGIYVPLFATIGWVEKSTMITVFFIMTGLLCLMAKYLTRHPVIAKAIERYGHVVTPFVLVLLGVYILYESGAFGLLDTAI